MPQIIGSFYLDLSCIFALHDPHDGKRVKNTHCCMVHVKHHGNQIWFNCFHVCSFSFIVSHSFKSCFFCSGLFANLRWNWRTNFDFSSSLSLFLFVHLILYFLLNIWDHSPDQLRFLWQSQLSVASLLQMPQLASQPKLHLALCLCTQWKWKQETKREDNPDFTVHPTSASVCTCPTKPNEQTNNHTRSNFWKPCQLSNTPQWDIPKHQSSNHLPRFQTTFKFRILKK